MEDPEFAEQLRQESLTAAGDVDTFESGRTRTDPDGTVFEWDAEKRAWFPKIDTDFIARYQMNYGTDVATTTSDSVTSTSVITNTGNSGMSTDSSYQRYCDSVAGGQATTTITDSKAYQEWYNYYYGQNSQTTKNNTQESGSANQNSSSSNQDNPETASSIPPAPEDINSEEYYNWYYKYYGGYSQDQNTTEVPTQEPKGDEWDQYWRQYETAPEKTDDVSEGGENEGKDKDEEDDSGDDKTEAADQKGKRKAEPPSWFDVNETKNTNVYVTGLPPDFTDLEFQDLMNKYGLIMFDPLTRKPKLKLYKDENGQNKGDGRCCFIKSESVDLALQFLDGSDIRGHKVFVEKAKFELKGNYDPTKRRRKLTKQEKKKFKAKQEKLFDWRPDKPLGTRNRCERVVILKNAFDPKAFEKDPSKIKEVQQGLEKEGAKFGEVKKVMIYDRHVEGVAGITFTEFEEADACIVGMNNQLFSQRLLTAAVWDGRTKYQIHETDEEREKRLKGWTDYLEGGPENKKTSENEKKSSTDTEQPPSDSVNRENVSSEDIQKDSSLEDIDKTRVMEVSEDLAEAETSSSENCKESSSELPDQTDRGSLPEEETEASVTSTSASSELPDQTDSSLPEEETEPSVTSTDHTDADVESVPQAETNPEPVPEEAGASGGEG